MVKQTTFFAGSNKVCDLTQLPCLMIWLSNGWCQPLQDLRTLGKVRAGHCKIGNKCLVFAFRIPANSKDCGECLVWSDNKSCRNSAWHVLFIADRLLFFGKIGLYRLKHVIWRGMQNGCLLNGDGSKPWYLVNPKIAGKWMFIPLKMVLIGIDPYPNSTERNNSWAFHVVEVCSHGPQSFQWRVMMHPKLNTL